MVYYRWFLKYCNAGWGGQWTAFSGVYGKVTESGLGLCFENLGWGELSLLPEKYNYLIEDIYSITHGKEIETA